MEAPVHRRLVRLLHRIGRVIIQMPNPPCPNVGISSVVNVEGEMTERRRRLGRRSDRVAALWIAGIGVLVGAGIGFLVSPLYAQRTTGPAELHPTRFCSAGACNFGHATGDSRNQVTMETLPKTICCEIAPPKAKRPWPGVIRLIDFAEVGA